ncbi:nose resistant to fluoxetine protein 6-like [Galleria mellonella]|uniref:Nose resistant to fluoxetine protein 6-like n=1 Tax=Galleria mellonella TaxID=7137 RepID=A0ABM3MXS0_GALME|nr:nose resistant to fluoxetine protein 6-like [Galleria mellonella]
MFFKFILIIIASIVVTVNGYLQMVVPDNKNAFDLNLYQEVLDAEQCAAQIKYILRNNTMLLSQFLNAGPKTPRGLLKGNLVDLGSYYECLEIQEKVQNMDIEGKYCMVSIPLNQEFSTINLSEELDLEDISWPELPWTELNSKKTRIKKSTFEGLLKYKMLKAKIQEIFGLTSENILSNEKSSGQLPNLKFNLAVCIPKPCSVNETFKNLLGGLSEVKLDFTEEYCRLPNDKPWTAVDYVALVIFTIIGVLIFLSTFYDIRHEVILKKDAKTANKLYRSFSIYTNTRRLVTYTPSPGALECMDGIRAIAMMWVIIGHTFANQMVSATVWNPLDGLNWISSFWSLWITTAPITVDTFFMMAGLLIVYTTAEKMTRSKLIKNLHLFYLNRYLRLFPVLAASVLLQASLFNRVTDGPNWNTVAQQTHQCRVYWWPTLLYIHNYYSPRFMCLPHTWYLAIDFQLFFLSPIILFWVVSGRKRTAWVGLFAGLLISLSAATIFNFIMGFRSASITVREPKEGEPNYDTGFYINTLTRAPPFFVGMIIGYVLHIFRGKKVVIPKIQVTLLWLLTIVLSSAVIFSNYPILQADWDNQLADNFLNSFQRSTWAMCIGWLIFSCVHGYGGPINWLLSLRMWKILGRLSYAMYILHYQLIFVINGTLLSPIYFNVEFSIRQFIVDFTISLLVAFAVTLCVDSPCSVLIKYFLGGSKRSKSSPAIPSLSIENKKDTVEVP